MLFGVRDGKLGRNGMMLLRREGETTALAIEMAPLAARPGPLQAAEITVRTSHGRLARQSFTLTDSPNAFEIPLAGEARFGIYQIEWQFDYAECEHPGACYSAELISARLLGTDPI